MKKLMKIAVIFFIVCLGISSFLPTLPAGAEATGNDTSGRIVVISNETSILLALGPIEEGLEPFPATLQDRVAIDVTGQVVDGNYTPIWQDPFSNNAIGDTEVHWSFGDEPDRSHTEPVDTNGIFHFVLIPKAEGPATKTLRLWFDGKSDGLYGIPIYPAVKEVYEVSIASMIEMSVNVMQDRVVAGGLASVSGKIVDHTGQPVPDEGVIPYFNGEPVFLNPSTGVKIDNLFFGPLSENFDLGPGQFEAGGRGTQWKTATGSCDMGNGYEYETDAHILSPAVDLTGFSNVMLQFDYIYDAPDADEFTVELSTDGGSTWPVVFEPGRTASWKTYSIGMTDVATSDFGTVPVAGQENVLLRARFHSTGTPMVSDEKGGFVFTLEIDEMTEPGDFILTAVHPATTSYSRIQASDPVRVTRRPVLDIDAGDMYRNEPSEILVRLTDGNQPLPEYMNGKKQQVVVSGYLTTGGNDVFLGEKPLDKFGMAVFGYKPDRAAGLGSSRIVFSFPGNDYYEAAEAETSIWIKAHTALEITSPTTASVLTGSSFEIEGRLTVVLSESVDTRNRDPVGGRTVKISVCDPCNQINVETNTSGVFRTTYAPADGFNPGSLRMTATFDGDFTHAPSTTSVDFSVLEATFIEAQPITVDKGDNAVIKGKLMSTSGPMAGEKVGIYIGGYLYRNVETDEAGNFAGSYNIPWESDLGPRKIKIVYAGRDGFWSSEKSIDMTVTASTTISLEQDPVEGVPGGTAILRGHLSEQWESGPGVPVGSALVEITLHDGDRVQVITGPEGKFSYIYDIPVDMDHGRHSIGISVVDAGDHLAPSQTGLSLDITVGTNIRFGSITETSTHVNDVTMATVELSTTTGEPLANEPVTVFYEYNNSEAIVFQGFTRSDGTTEFPVTFQEPGSYVIRARYGGSDYLTGSEDSEVIVVTGKAVEPVPVHRHPVVVLGSGLSILMLLAIFGTESGKYFLLKFLLVPLYTKIKKVDVLDHFIRGQIYGLIRMNPGAHYSLIKKKLDLTNGVLSYHLSTLEREGYLIAEQDGIYKRFYPNHMKFEARYPVILSRIQETILDFIKANPGKTQKEIAKEVGVSTSTANDNIKILKQLELLLLKRDGKRTRCFAIED
jgi:predicted transcriptional regulator